MLRDKMTSQEILDHISVKEHNHATFTFVDDYGTTHCVIVHRELGRKCPYAEYVNENGIWRLSWSNMPVMED